MSEDKRCGSGSMTPVDGLLRGDGVVVSTGTPTPTFTDVVPPMSVDTLTQIMHLCLKTQRSELQQFRQSVGDVIHEELVRVYAHDGDYSTSEVLSLLHQLLTRVESLPLLTEER